MVNPQVIYKFMMVMVSRGEETEEKLNTLKFYVWSLHIALIFMSMEYPAWKIWYNYRKKDLFQMWKNFLSTQSF